MFDIGFPRDWSSLKKLIWLKAAISGGGASAVWKTVTGTLIHVTDALASPMQKCEVTLEPIQDLHGQDAPYPAGGGANKFDKTAAVSGYYISDSTGEALPNAKSVITDYIPVVGGESYRFITPTGQTSGKWGGWYDENKDAISGFAFYTAVQTAPSNARYVRATVVYNSTQGNIDEFAVNYPSTVTTYSPYSNICPITGWTGCEVTRTGKNLCDASTLYRGGIDPSSGALTDTGVRVTSDYIPVSAGKTYYGSESSGNVFVAFHCYNKNKENAGSTNVTTNPYTIPEGVYYVRAMFRKEDGTASVLPSEIKKPQIEESTTATDYEPYSGTTLSVTFPDTVYGGSHEFVSGGLKSEMASVDLGTLDWTKATITNRFIAQLSQAKKFPNLYTTPDLANLVCSSYKTIGGNDGYSGTYDYGISGSFWNGANYLQINDLEKCQTMDATQFKTAMSGVQLVYELAEPIEIQLTPQEISTLKGVNNVWSNSNGETTLIYKAQA